MKTEKPVSASLLKELVQKKLPASVFRCKGIFWDAESPRYRQTLQAVGRRVEIRQLDEWGDRRQSTQLVAIGREFDPEVLDELFNSLLLSG